jgi:uncharacterized protein
MEPKREEENMATYRTPGVYVEEISLIPPSVAEVATAIPAFIGYTERVPANYDFGNPEPVRITSMFEYEYYFGGPSPVDIEVSVTEDVEDVDTVTVESISDIVYLMHHNLQMYFNNGGGPCYIVSVGDYTATKSSTAFEDGINALRNEDEPTLIVLTDATTLITPPDPSTSTDGDGQAYYELCVHALQQCGDLKDRFTIADVVQVSASSLNSARIDTDSANMRNWIVGENLKYGAAYYPYIRTSMPNYYLEGDAVGTPGAVQVTITEWDDSIPGPGTPVTYDLGNPALREQMTDRYNAVKAELNNHRITMPPSGAVAGIYARVDRTRGVWKAPANVSVLSILGPDIKINSDQQELLNVHSTGKSIDAIRAFVGKGTLVWGARTLAGNDNEWRYVSVRRLFNMIEESVQESTEWAVFEGNDAMTWLKVKTQIEVYLEGLWRQGALAGPSPAAAFFVNVGLGVTMNNDDILNGRMNIEIGIAAVRPAEFIILKFSHKMQEA